MQNIKSLITQELEEISQRAIHKGKTAIEILYSNETKVELPEIQKEENKNSLGRDSAQNYQTHIVLQGIGKEEISIPREDEMLTDTEEAILNTPQSQMTDTKV